MMRRLLSLLAVAVLLGGCASGYGVTRVKATMEDGELTSFEWLDGKEKSYVSIKRGVAGDFEYVARDVIAFDGQRIALEIYANLAQAGVDVSEAIVRGAVSAALGTSLIDVAGGVVGAAAAAARARAGTVEP